MKKNTKFNSLNLSNTNFIKKEYSEIGIQIKKSDFIYNKNKTNTSLEKKQIEPENFFTGQNNYENITIMKGYIYQNKYDRIYYINISKNITETLKIKKESNLEFSIKEKSENDIDYPKANILIIHGYGDSARLVNFGINLAKKKNIVHLFDINGFGFSGGKRFNANVDDIFGNFSAILKMMLRNKNIPLIIYAEGYGALFIMHYQILYNINIAGLVLVSPWIDIPKAANLDNFYLKYFFIKILGKIFDDVLLNNFISGNDLYEDSMKLWEYRNNPLKIPFFGIQFIQALIKSTIFVKNNSKE